MALDIQTALLRTASSINQRIGRTSNNLHLDALAVLDVDGSTAIYWRCIGQRQAVKLNSSLIGARHIELAIRRSA